MAKRLDKRAPRTTEFSLQNIMYLLYGDPSDLNTDTYIPLFHKINQDELEKRVPERQINLHSSIEHPELFSVYFSFKENSYQKNFAKKYFNKTNINLNDQNRIFFELHFADYLELVSYPSTRLYARIPNDLDEKRRTTNMRVLLKGTRNTSQNKSGVTGVRERFIHRLHNEDNFESLVLINQNILTLWDIKGAESKITDFFTSLTYSENDNALKRVVHDLQLIIRRLLKEQDIARAITWLLISGVLLEDIRQLPIFHQAVNSQRIVPVSSTPGKEENFSKLLHKLFPERKIGFVDAKYEQLSKCDYQPRTWLSTDLDEQIIKNNKNIIILLGPPGSGKSHFLANYIKKQANVYAYYFCEWNIKEKNTLSLMIKEIALQIASHSALFCEHLLETLNEKSMNDLLSLDNSQLFYFLLCKPVIELPEKAFEKQLIIIDALDELNTPLEFVHLLQDYSAKLESYFTFIISTRPNHHLVHSLKIYPVINISANVNDNSKDIYSYIRNRLDFVYDIANSDCYIDMLAKNSENNYLYAKYVCDNIRNGSLSLEAACTELSGISGIYQQYFRRLYPDLNVYKSEYKKAFEVILAACEPLSVHQLQTICSWNNNMVNHFIELTSDLLILEYLPEKIVFFHKSIYDWMQSYNEALEYQADIKNGYDLLFHNVFQQYKINYISMDYHFVKYWQQYAHNSRHTDDYEHMMNDTSFLLWTAEVFRRHSEFTLAISILKKIILLECDSYSETTFRAKLLLGDIYLDLEEHFASEYTYKLMEESNLYQVDDLYLLIHLYENAGWQYMLDKQFENAKATLYQALNCYKTLPLSVAKRKAYSHTLYILGNILYRMGKYDECEETIQHSQDILLDLDSTKSSLSYALNTKMLGWVQKKKGNYELTSMHFNDALSVEIALHGEESFYVANTYCAIAENELQLYQAKQDLTYFNSAKEHLKNASDTYVQLMGPHHSRLKQIEKLKDFIKKIEEELECKR